MHSFKLLPVILTVISCSNNENNPEFEKEKISNEGKVLNVLNSIDYKSGNYKIFIGQDKDSVDKVIELRHDYLADDGVINDKGVTHYMNISEDLIKIGSSDEVLPALFFTVNRKKVVGFTCSIVFAPDTVNKRNIMKFLNVFDTHFVAIRSQINKAKLVNNLMLDIGNRAYKEKFKLDTTGNKYQVVFRYVKEAK